MRITTTWLPEVKILTKFEALAVITVAVIITVAVVMFSATVWATTPTQASTGKGPSKPDWAPAAGTAGALQVGASMKGAMMIAKKRRELFEGKNKDIKSLEPMRTQLESISNRFPLVQLLAALLNGCIIVGTWALQYEPGPLGWGVVWLVAVLAWVPGLRPEVLAKLPKPP